MSTETLREAAALIRERAEAATPGPWVHLPTSACGPGTIGGHMGADYDEHVLMSKDHATEDAAHIASWHPLVALSVADWLDAVARTITPTGEPTRDFVAAEVLHLDETETALAVAHAYLGEQP